VLLCVAVACGGESGGSTATPPPVVTPPATQLAFVAQPVSAVVGASFTPAIQVVARDAQGNTATGYTGAVTLSLSTNTAGAALSGTTSVNATAGIATFAAVNVTKVGSGYTLVASAPSLTSATSGAFTVGPGAASKLVFTAQPTSATAASAIAPAVQVTAQDANGNTATGFTGLVTIAVGANSGGGTLSGTMSVAAVAGVATFSNLTIDRAGTAYVLTATASGLTSAVSTPFDVTAPVTATTLYISPLLDFKLHTTPKARTSAAIEWCVSTSDWLATLAESMVGTSYTFSLGVKTATGSSGSGTLRGDIIHKRGTTETILATATFTTTTTYEVKTATVVGVAPDARAGDLLILRVRIVAGVPCVAEFIGPGTDNFIVVPKTTIAP
jgi:hypothetical protein